MHCAYKYFPFYTIYLGPDVRRRRKLPPLTATVAVKHLPFPLTTLPSTPPTTITILHSYLATNLPDPITPSTFLRLLTAKLRPHPAFSTHSFLIFTSSASSPSSPPTPAPVSPSSSFAPTPTSVGMTGEVELAGQDGPFVKISLRGGFWHKRSTILARVGNYLKQRIPEILEVDIEDEKQLDDSSENFLCKFSGCSNALASVNPRRNQSGFWLADGEVFQPSTFRLIRSFCAKRRLEHTWQAVMDTCHPTPP